MKGPGPLPRVLSEPFASGKGTSNHDNGSQKLLDVLVPVLAMFDASGSDAHNDARRKKVNDIVENGREGGDLCFDHGAGCTVQCSSRLGFL